MDSGSENQINDIIQLAKKSTLKLGLALSHICKLMSLLSMYSQPSAAHLEGVFKQMTERKKIGKWDKMKSCSPHKHIAIFLHGVGKRVMNSFMRPKEMGIDTEADMGMHHSLIIN